MEHKASFKDIENNREIKNRELSYEIASEGIVLLKNEGILPIDPCKIALYGAGAEYKTTGGSGSGEVNARFGVNIYEGLKNKGFAITSDAWIKNYSRIWKKGKEDFIKATRKDAFKPGGHLLAKLMAAEYTYPSGERITEKDIADSDTDTCIYVVSRQSGEGKDRKDEAGSFRLDSIEIENIALCASSYQKFILVINTGCIIDLSPLDEIENINAIIYMGQLGMETGNALADILTGENTPCGHLAVSWPYSYKDVPTQNNFGPYNKEDRSYYREGVYVGYRYYDSFHKKVRYPFGYGLSYTNFSYKVSFVKQDEEKIVVEAEVTNTGSHKGKALLQLYALMSDQSQSERKRLVGFEKSDLLRSGESQKLQLSFALEYLSSYDEEKAETCIEKGNYVLCLGSDVEETKACFLLNVKEKIVLSKHHNLCKASAKVSELCAEKTDETYDDLPSLVIDDSFFETEIFDYEEREERFSEETKKYLETFSDEQLAQFVCGTGLFGENKGFRAPGAVGHSTTDFIAQGIPNVEFADGPAGLRLQKRSALSKDGKIKAIDDPISIYQFLPSFVTKLLKGDPEKDQVIYQFVTGFPVAAVLAQTFNTKLAYRMGEAVAAEMKEYGVSYWLAPALNIVRDPLCGRNYEYYSEDPILSGLMAANVCKGVQKNKGLYVTIKHFAANNQETDRYSTSSIVDEKVLREIYLKGFEIAVKQGRPKAVMSAYNQINDVFCANNKELCTDILRNEWGFEGIVMTDWLSTGKDRASEHGCIKAGVDLIMPGGKKVVKMIIEKTKSGELDRRHLKTSAGRFIGQILDTKN